ncbi:MAG: prephenate dehydrogenase/arogenate dehydrogenase family protein [Fervidobacterium sp.]|nr:prephenate dehydrogenase/arogenate dehydrogenase family protein [Fervidobacterium sp.]
MDEKILFVLGLGKMGSWFKESLEKFVLQNPTYKGWKVLGYDKNMNIPLENVLTAAPSIVLNCVSLDNVVDAFKSVESFIDQQTVLCDIASVKTNLAQFYTNSQHKFCSFHPMFGPTFAKMDRIKGENVIFIKGSDEETTTFFEEFFFPYSMKFFYMTFEEHDEMMAYSLSVPFIASFVFGSRVDNTVVPGTTFKKHIDILLGLLSEDDKLISEILFNKHSVKEIEKISSNLEYLKHIVMDKDQEELSKFLKKLRVRFSDVLYRF